MKNAQKRRQNVDGGSGGGGAARAADIGKRTLTSALDDQTSETATRSTNGVRGESAGAHNEHAPASSRGLAAPGFATPISGPPPVNAITIHSFINLVKAEEARWPIAEQTQTGLMISRIRKIFYGTKGWDDYLIPGAASISSGYNISEEETSRESLAWGMDIVRKHQVTTDASGNTPAIASQKEVRLEDDTFCDIGHVFAGLDAANHPDSVAAPLNIAKVKSNLAATTWVGDLGSVVGEVGFAMIQSGKPVSDATKQAKVRDFAPAQDLLGNIDAYVMDDQYDTTDGAGRKVSDLLAAYYQGAGGTSDGEARRHRYSRYSRLVGLTGWNGSAFANEAAWLDTWRPEVGGAAALYFGANMEAKWFRKETEAENVLLIQNLPIVSEVLAAYLNALKTMVAREPRPSTEGPR